MSASTLRSAAGLLPGRILASFAGIEPEQYILRLADGEQLDLLAGEIDNLAKCCTHPNPFHVAPFLGAMLDYLIDGPVQFLYLTERLGECERMVVFCPVVRRRVGLQRHLVWYALTHDYCPIGTPLHENEIVWQVFTDCLERVAGGAPQALVIHQGVGLPEESVGCRVVRKMRGGLSPIPNGDYDTTKLSGKRRRRLRTARNWLEAKGDVCFVEAVSNGGFKDELIRFRNLEAAGWKGKRGTALAQDGAALDFMDQALPRAMEAGVASLLWLTVGDKPAAGLISLEYGGWVWPWKIAYDEGLSSGSPGVLLMSEISRRCVVKPGFAGLDSLASPQNRTANQVWPDMIDCSTMVIGCGAKGHLAANHVAMALRRREKARGLAKQGLERLGLRR